MTEDEIKKDLNISPDLSKLLIIATKDISYFSKQDKDVDLRKIEIRLFLKQKRLIKDLLKTKPKGYNNYEFLHSYIRKTYIISEKDLNSILYSFFYFKRSFHKFLIFLLQWFLIFFSFIILHYLSLQSLMIIPFVLTIFWIIYFLSFISNVEEYFK